MFYHFHLGDTYPAPKGVKDQKISSSVPVDSKPCLYRKIYNHKTNIDYGGEKWQECP